MGDSEEARVYTVNGMTCSSCTMLVSEELEEMAGVAAVDADLGSRRVTVRGTGLDDAAIRSTLRELGYEAS